MAKDYDPNQITLFDLIMPQIEVNKPIRLIELFAGYGSQALALEYLGVDFQHYKMVEFDKYAVASYNAVHGTNFPVLDITNIHGDELEIVDINDFTYLLTYLFVPMHRFICRWTYGGNGRRKWNKIKSVMGSQKIT